MNQISTIKFTIMSAAGAVGSAIARAFGGWGEDMKTLLIFMAIDFLLGLLIAAVWKKSGKSETGSLNSMSAWKGLVKKGVTLLVVLVAHRLDILIGADYIRTAVIIAFCANELLSIIENLGIMGIPMPEMIKKAVEVLQNKAKSEVK